MAKKVKKTSKKNGSSNEGSLETGTRPGYGREVSSAGGHACINPQPFSCECCNFTFGCMDLSSRSSYR